MFRELILKNKHWGNRRFSFLVWFNWKSEEEEGENYYRLERQTGQFSREFILPSKIDPNSVEAKAKNGTITITLKKQPSEQKRKVQIIK